MSIVSKIYFILHGQSISKEEAQLIIKELHQHTRLEERERVIKVQAGDAFVYCPKTDVAIIIKTEEGENHEQRKA